MSSAIGPMGTMVVVNNAQSGASANGQCKSRACLQTGAAFIVFADYNSR